MPDTTLQISYSLSNIENAADQLWQYAHHCRIWTFSGSLGAGKTTLIRALCLKLGVQEAVSSPTFALINEYSLPGKNDEHHTIAHMDWYRISSVEEAIQAGMEDMLMQPDTRCFIEWPEQAPELLHSLSHVKIFIDIPDHQPEQRLLTTTCHMK